MKPKFVSIIMVHYAQDKERSETMRKSILSLMRYTEFPYELIVIDNGGSESDTRYLNRLVDSGIIHTYIRNNNNRHFGYARNQGLQIANGQYLCIVDNDILYQKGWLTKCVGILDAYPDRKIYATPIYNVAHWSDKYWTKEVLELNGEKWSLNSRAGSNCFVARRKDFKKIGRFSRHRVAGTKWTERAIQLGYVAAVTPFIMIKDMGFRKVYPYHKPIPIRIKLSNGREVYFNQDEYKKFNKLRIHYIQQGSFSAEDGMVTKKTS